MSTSFSHTVIQSGQPRPYADNIYTFTITAPPEATDAEVWAYCQTIRKVDNRDDKQRHDGSCGFPFGLSWFGSLRKQTAASYFYGVTEPYCD